MNIRQRISLLIAIVFVALVAIGGFAVLEARRSEAEVRAVTNGVVPSAMKSVQLMAQLKDVQIAALGIVDAADPAIVEQTRQQLAKRKADLQAALADQLVHADSKAQEGLVKEAQESLQNYFAAIDEAARFAANGQKELAQASMAANVDQYLREQGEVMQTLQVEKNRSKDVAIARMNDNLSRTQGTLWIVTTAAVLILGAIGGLLYRQIVRPISEMQAKMTDIATSQDFTHRVPVARMDEIGKSMVAFNAMIEKIQASSELVQQKTADIHAMLHSVPQGILSIEAGGTIHHEYSDYLVTVLETAEIAGRSVMEAIFGDSDLGADALAQVDVALGACIGEDEMNFSFNEHLLPREIAKRMPGGTTKILDLNWSPILDDHGIATRLLLCVRDVTELRSLARAASAQARELSLIGEILAVPHEKFAAFAESARGLLDDNEQLLERTMSDDVPGSVATLFRNMHTVKGNARTLGLKLLAEAAHGAEDTYDRMRRGQSAWDAPRLRSELGQVREALVEYMTVNEVKLGRHGPGRRGAVDRFVMMATDDVRRLLDTIARGERAEPGAARRALGEARELLRRAGTETLAETLAVVLDALPALAHELGKEPPEVVVRDRGIRLRNQAGGMLRDVFGHLLRNALDHGLEAPDERVSRGKAARGRVTLEATLDAEELRLILQDDGRGLALDRIHAKAVAAGVVDPQDVLSPQEIAALVFVPGFSTAETVSGISGRGVGMDAVRAFVEREGGRIELELQAGATDGARPFRTVIALPARLASPAGAPPEEVGEAA